MELMTALIPQTELSASYRLCGCSADLLLQQHTCEIMPSGMQGDHSALLAWLDPFLALMSLLPWLGGENKTVCVCKKLQQV